MIRSLIELLLICSLIWLAITGVVILWRLIFG